MSNDNKIITLNNLTAFKDELDAELNTKQDVIDNLPEIIFIDDEIQVNKKAVFYSLKRPFTILQQCCSN